jgi:hypothetical protein
MAEVALILLPYLVFSVALALVLACALQDYQGHQTISYRAPSRQSDARPFQPGRVPLNVSAR